MSQVGPKGQVGRVGRKRSALATRAACVVVFVSSLSAFSTPLDLPDLAALPDSAGQPAKPNGRLFGTQDLGLLEAPDRDQWQKPDQIMDALGVAEGSNVAELGAAGGWFTLRLAERVGPNGNVYAEDIQQAMLDGIRRRMQSQNRSNVKTVLGAASDPHLPGGLDAALISDAFHEMDLPEDPKAVVTLLRNIARALKPQGRLGIVDWTPGGGGPGPKALQRGDPKRMIEVARAAGLQLIKREDFPPFVFLMVFGKASAKPTP